MTIEELLDLSADELEKMTDEELKVIFKPYETITRPELATKPEAGRAKRVSSLMPVNKAKQAKIDRAFELAAAMGIKLK